MKDKYKTLITACWIVLICCFVVKLLGGNWFEIACTNEKFIAFCNVIEGTIIKYILMVLFYVVGTSLYLLAIFKQKMFKGKEFIIIPLLVLISIIKCVFEKYGMILMFLEIFVMIILPILKDKKLWLRSIITCLLTLLFQIVSLITKNLGVKVLPNNSFVNMIFSIDYYIMLILYYLYSLKEDKNGCLGFIFSRFRKRRND